MAILYRSVKAGKFLGTFQIPTNTWTGTPALDYPRILKTWLQPPSDTIDADIRALTSPFGGSTWLYEAEFCGTSFNGVPDSDRSEIIFRFLRGEKSSGQWLWRRVNLTLGGGTFGNTDLAGKTVKLDIDLNNPSTAQVSGVGLTTVPFTVRVYINNVLYGITPIVSYSTGSWGTTPIYGDGESTYDYVFAPVWDSLDDVDDGYPGPVQGQAGIDLDFTPGFLKISPFGVGAFVTESSCQIQGNVRTQNSASISGESQFIAAPGRIQLAQANFSSDFSTEPTGSGDYIEDGYFSTAQGLYVERNIYQGILARVIYSGLSNISADFSVTAQGRQTHANNSWLADNVFVDNFTATNGIKANSTTLADTALATQGTRTAGASADLQADLAQTAVARNIIDIGQQYAWDWADDYFDPYYYLSLLVESQLYAAASVEIIPYANLFAESDITGNGGYLQGLAQSLISGTTDITLPPFTLQGGTGVVYNQLTELAADSQQSALGGLTFRAASQLNIDTAFDTSGGRFQLLAAQIQADFLVNSTSDLFKGTPVNLSVDTALFTTGGKYWTAQTLLAANFLVPDIRSRIISIDEYYVDKVQREFRNITVFKDQRTIWIPVEPRTLAVFQEDRINQVTPENRYLRPEPGTPIQVGSRNRRITA